MAMQLQEWIRQQQVGDDFLVVEGQYNNRRPLTKLGHKAYSPDKSRSKSQGKSASPPNRSPSPQRSKSRSKSREGKKFI